MDGVGADGGPAAQRPEATHDVVDQVLTIAVRFQDGPSLGLAALTLNRQTKVGEELGGDSIQRARLTLNNRGCRTSRYRGRL